MGPFKKGAFRLAIDLGLPILPVTILGTNHILPKGTPDLFPGNVDMIIHPPIPTRHYHREDIAKLMERARRQIESVLPKD